MIFIPIYPKLFVSFNKKFKNSIYNPIKDDYGELGTRIKRKIDSITGGHG